MLGDKLRLMVFMGNACRKIARVPTRALETSPHAPPITEHRLTLSASKPEVVSFSCTDSPRMANNPSGGKDRWPFNAANEHGGASSPRSGESSPFSRIGQLDFRSRAYQTYGAYAAPFMLRFPCNTHWTRADQLNAKTRKSVGDLPLRLRCARGYPLSCQSYGTV